MAAQTVFGAHSVLTSLNVSTKLSMMADRMMTLYSAMLMYLASLKLWFR